MESHDPPVDEEEPEQLGTDPVLDPHQLEGLPVLYNVYFFNLIICI